MDLQQHFFIVLGLFIQPNGAVPELLFLLPIRPSSSSHCPSVSHIVAIKLAHRRESHCSHSPIVTDIFLVGQALSCHVYGTWKAGDADRYRLNQALRVYVRDRDWHHERQFRSQCNAPVYSPGKNIGSIVLGIFEGKNRAEGLCDCL